jgi:hypothetical protein
MKYLEILLNIGELIFLIITVFIAKKQFGVQKASAYIERFNSVEMLNARTAVDQWTVLDISDEDKIEKILNDIALQNHIRMFVNLFQELGVAYIYGGVHKKTVRDNFDFLIPYYWKKLNFWVVYLRNYHNDQTLLHKFEMLAEKMEYSKK